MTRAIRLLSVAASLAGVLVTTAAARDLKNLFFLHHSTGRNLLAQGEIRAALADSNGRHGTNFVLWDHDYNALGLTDPAGHDTPRCYVIPGDNTDPDGLYTLWTTTNAARDSILANHQVIAFKSCYPASHVASDAALDQYKSWYLAIRDELDRHPDKMFVVMSPPPLHPCHTNANEADRARAFADWLRSPAFLSGHPNVVCFDLFDALAEPRDATTQRNTLRAAYRNTSECASADSHPNRLANEEVGSRFLGALLRAAGGSVPVERESLGGLKDAYR